MTFLTEGNKNLSKKKILCIPIECIPPGWTYDDMVTALEEKKSIPYLSEKGERPFVVEVDQLSFSSNRDRVIDIPDHLRQNPMTVDEAYKGPVTDEVRRKRYNG